MLIIDYPRLTGYNVKIKHAFCLYLVNNIYYHITYRVYFTIIIINHK